MTRFLLVLWPLFACSSSGESTSVPSSVEPQEVAAAEGEEQAAATPEGPSEVPVVVAQDTFGFEGSVDFISVKNRTIAVPGRVSGLQGEARAEKLDLGVVALEGAVEIPLASLTTDLAIRDQRIQNTFFGMSEGNSARFLFKEMKTPAEGSRVMWIDGALEIGPFSQDLRAHLLVKEERPGEWVVESGESMVVKISKLGMSGRLATLVELCAHESIDDSVEVRLSGVISIPETFQ